MTAACVTNTKLAIAKRAEQHFEKSMACSDAATMDRKNTFLRANGVLISSYYRSLACKTDALPAMHRMSDRNAMAVLPPVSSPLGTLSTYTSVITSYGSLPEAQVRRYCLGECQDAYHATENVDVWAAWASTASASGDATPHQYGQLAPDANGVTQ